MIKSFQKSKNLSLDRKTLDVDFSHCKEKSSVGVEHFERDMADMPSKFTVILFPHSDLACNNKSDK